MSHSTESLSAKIQELVKMFSEAPAAIEPLPQLPSKGAELAQLIDHTLLAPASTLEQIRAVCQQSKQLGTATVCVNSSMIPTVAAELSGSSVKPISVVGFPFGSANTQSKALETTIACQQGAKEIDMVQNVGLLKSGELLAVYEDVKAVVDAAREGNAIVKVIIETALLSRDEIIASTYLSCLAGAAFVKTSTGYGGGGAKAEDIRLMHAVANTEGLGWSTSPAPLIKASGGIRSLATVRTMVENGASRVGASGTQAILDEAAGKQPTEKASGY